MFPQAITHSEWFVMDSYSILSWLSRNFEVGRVIMSYNHIPKLQGNHTCICLLPLSFQSIWQNSRSYPVLEQLPCSSVCPSSFRNETHLSPKSVLNCLLHIKTLVKDFRALYQIILLFQAPASVLCPTLSMLTSPLPLSALMEKSCFSIFQSLL
jgi:hypothetical protein